MPTNLSVFCVICAFAFCLSLSGGEARGESAPPKGIDLAAPRTALLVVDIQNDYFPGGKFELENSEGAGLLVKKVIEVFREKGFPVIHIRHEGKGMGFFEAGTEGQKIHACASPASGESTLTKQKVSSFEGTPLETQLKELRIERLVIVGMQTDVCVNGAVQDALKLEYEVIVLGDATAAKNPENYAAGLASIKEGGARIMTVEEFLGAVSG